jgi:hypothetical protein
VEHLILATQNDVEARLGRACTSGEVARVPGLLDEASAIVEGYLGITYTGSVPHAVVLVVSRMVARALTTAVSEGATSEAAGPYTVGYRDGAASLWLSKNDKLALRSISGGASSVRFVSERGFYCDGS